MLLGLLVVLASCREAANDAQARKPPANGTGAEHEHRAPHGGTLIELGEEFAHVELVLDRAAGQITAYVLDGEAEQPVRLEQASLTLTLSDLPPAGGETDVILQAVENVLTGETVGRTSQFRGASDRLKGVERFRGVVADVSVRGRTFTSVAFRFPEGNEQ
jgi:hypothetical protein